MPELETDPLKMVAIMLGLRDVTIVGVHENEDELVIGLEPASPPPKCAQCGETVVVVRAENREVSGQSAFGRPTTMSWQLRRFGCATPGCSAPEWIEEIPEDSVGDDALRK